MLKGWGPVTGTRKVEVLRQTLWRVWVLLIDTKKIIVLKLAHWRVGVL